MKEKSKATHTTRKGEKKETQIEWGKEMCKYGSTNKKKGQREIKIRTACKGE
jgi:hypothetical protein